MAERMALCWRPVWWVAFADDESGEIITRARISMRDERGIIVHVRDAVSLAEAVDYAIRHRAPEDMAPPRVFKRRPSLGDPMRPVLRDIVEHHQRDHRECAS